MKQSRMVILGVTGGVGSGKSFVLSHLEQAYGAFVVRSDEVGHLLMAPGGECYEHVLSLFGRECLLEDKSLNRARIAQEIFSSPGKKVALEAIIHPAVENYIGRLIKEQEKKGTRFFVIEAALLLEAGYDKLCDTLWYVYAPKKAREKWLLESRGYTEEKTRSIMDQQGEEEMFRRRCDLVLENTSTPQALLSQVDACMEELKASFH